MSKAILVIDMPSCCRECPVCASYAESAFSPREYWCSPMDNRDATPESKPDWCPLKPLPKEKLVWFDDSDYERGYNSCLRDIVGEWDEDDED